MKLDNIFRSKSSLSVLVCILCCSYLHAFTASAFGEVDVNHKTKAEDFFRDPIKITGKVIDQVGGDPLPGVNIMVQGTTDGAVTDIEGRFSLEVSSEESVLIFSYVGFVQEVVTVGSQTYFEVEMTQDVTSLTEVVVVGYGTMKKNEITSSVSSISSDDFNNIASRSPVDLIRGKVAGLNITRTQGNNPNSGTSIQLRGVTSLSGGNQPLIVIDGIPGGNLDLLQQNDIKSIDVLKDGSAAAIYGTRANGGVILITTKKGEAGKARFTYNGYVQRDFVNQKPDVLGRSEYVQAVNDGLINSGEDYGYDEDLYDALINEDNLSQYHTLAASGGSENSNYRASFFYKDSEGIAIENAREEFGGRLNFNQKGLNDHLTMQTNVAVNLNNANLLGGNVNRGDFDQAVRWNPTQPIIKDDGTYTEFEGDGYNPISVYDNRLSERDQQTISTDVKFTLDLWKGFSATAFGAYQRDMQNDRDYISKDDWSRRESTSARGTGYGRKRNYLDVTKMFESTLNYGTSINNHSVTALLGYSYQYRTNEEFRVSNTGFTTDAFEDWNLGAGQGLNNDDFPDPEIYSHKEDNTLVAFFGRVNYNYNEKYFAQFILRREGSSRFGDNNKYGNFPAVSLGWALHKENFLNNSSLIDNLKLRAGYGVTGNQDIANYQSLVNLSTGGVYPQDGVYYQTYGPSRNPNPDLKWEKKKEFNIGLDYTILNARISGSVDVYKRKTEDLLYTYSAQLPPFVQSFLFTNVGSISNQGIEVVIDAMTLQKGDFTWRTTFTGNYQDNKLDELSNANFKATYLQFASLPNPGNLGAAIRLEEGGAVGNFYGPRFAGFTEDGKWQFYSKDGDIISKGEVTDEDKTIIGNGVPKYNAALINSFTYKNFDLTLMLRGKFGFDILNAKDIYYGNLYTARGTNVLESALKKHRALNDDPVYSDYYLEKGAFVKLDNVTLGYTVPVTNQNISNFRVYVTGSNLFTITGYSGVDPELQDTGFDTGVDAKSFYPRTSSWTVGLNIGF